MWQAVITNAGNALLSQWAAGGTLKIEGASAETGTINAAELANASALANEVQELTISGMKIVEGGVLYRVQLTAAETAYSAQQIGIWASLNDGTKTLIAIYQDVNGVPVESTATMPNYVYSFDAIIEMNNDGELVVNINPTALVTQQELQEALDNLEITVDERVEKEGKNPVTGAAVYAFAGSGIPTPTEADAGKILRVSDAGAYFLSDIASAEGATF